MADLNLKLLVEAVVKNLTDVKDLKKEVEGVQEASRPRGGASPFVGITQGAKEAVKEVGAIPEKMAEVGTSARTAAREVGELPAKLGEVRVAAAATAAAAIAAFTAMATVIGASLREALTTNAGFRDLAAEAREAGVSIADAFGTAVDTASAKLLDLRTAQRATAELLRAGFAPSEITAGLDQITQAAIAYKRESESIEEATLRLAKAVATGKGEMVSGFGATRDASEVTAEYAARVGKSVEDVTALEGAQARLAEVYRAATTAINEQSPAADELTIAWTRFKNNITEVARILGEALLPAFNLLRSALAGLINVASSVVTGFVKPMLFGFQSLGAAVAYTVEVYKIGFEAIRNLSFEGVNERLRNAGKTLDEVFRDIAARIDRGTAAAGGGAPAGPDDAAERERLLASLREQKKEPAKPRAARRTGSRSEDLTSARFNLLKAEVEAEVKLTKDALDRALREYDYALQQNLISFRDAANARVQILQQEIDTQLAGRQRELDAQRRIANDPSVKESERFAAMGRVKTLTAEIEIAQRRRQDVSTEASRTVLRQEKELAEALARVRDELGQLTGQATSGDRRAAIEREFTDLRARLVAERNTDGNAAVGRLIDVRSARADFEAVERSYSQILARISTQEQSINVRRQAGLTTETQARQEILELYAREGVELERLIPQLERYNQTIGSEELANRIEQAKNKVVELRTRTDEFAGAFRGQLGGAFGQFFRDMSTGSKRIGDAFVDAFNRLRNAMLDLIAQRLGQQLVDSILGPANRSGGGGNLFGSLFNFLGFGGGGVPQLPGVTGWVSQGHIGGVVGRLSQARRVDPSVFLDAPRFHTGGMVGLRSGERPIIAQDGEEILTEDDPRHQRNLRGASNVTVNIQNEAPGTRARVTGSQTDSTGTQIAIMVEQVESAMTHRARSGQSAFASWMEGRYGLNRAAGAAR